MKAAACCLLLAVFLLSGRWTAPAASAQNTGQQARLTVAVDYGRRGADVDGTVMGGDSRPDLRAWGITVEQAWQRESGAPWSIRGAFVAAHLDAPGADGAYHLRIGPLALAPDDDLTLLFPFLSVDYARLSPPPDNLAELLTPPAQPTDVPPGVLGLRYSGGRTLTLDVPFTPLRQQITLAITPLIGEMLLRQPASFRVAGHVTFDGLHDFAEFQRYCQTDPAAPTYRYRVAELLFSLDAPPVYSMALQNALYQFKPVQLFVSSDLGICHFDTNGGRVEAVFDGRVSALSPALARQFPVQWLTSDPAAGTGIVLATNRSIALPAGRGQAYRLVLGGITLGPEDTLTVTMPGADLRTIAPPPTRFDVSNGRPLEAVYAGPQRLALTITYAPTASLILAQFPTIVRALTRPIERALQTAGLRLPASWNGLLALEGVAWSWHVLVLAFLLLAVAERLHDRLQVVVGGGAWALAAVALLYTTRGAFGLLVLALLAYLYAGRKDNRSAGYILRGLAALLLTAAAAALDQRADRLFVVLTTLELQTTPITPLVALTLAALLVMLLAFPRRQRQLLLPRASLAVTVALVTLATMDVFQKSLPSLLVVGVGVAYVQRRLPRAEKGLEAPTVVRRFRTAWRSRLIPIGGALLVLFAAQNGLRSTTAVLGGSLGPWSLPLGPLLLLVSIVEGYLAIAALYLFLYPALPFQTGYLKAASLAAYLLVIFTLGLGADDRLLSTLPALLVGRAIYYLGVPLLIGLYFDIDRFRRQQTGKQSAGTTANVATFDQAATTYLERVHGVVSTAGSIVALVAPQAYALVTGNPLVVNYFDLLAKLLSQAKPI